MAVAGLAAERAGVEEPLGPAEMWPEASNGHKPVCSTSPATAD